METHNQERGSRTICKIQDGGGGNPRGVERVTRPRIPLTDPWREILADRQRAEKLLFKKARRAKEAADKALLRLTEFQNMSRDLENQFKKSDVDRWYELEYRGERL